jgi:predicted nucleic acid-binding Zn ribbon protein
MKFCSVVPEICRGQVHVPKKERRRKRRRRIPFFLWHMNLSTADLRNY